MSFFNMAAFIGLVSVPVIIAMYLFKKKSKEKEISSIMLWRMATKDNQSEKSFQKLKKNLLMILQIITALLIVFSLARPYITKNEKVENMIIILDASMSMHTYDDGINRFDAAKGVIEEMIENSNPNSRISLIRAENEAEILLNREIDKNIIKNRLEETEAGNGAVNLPSVAETAKMIKSEEDATIYLFTDKEYENESINVINIGKSENNCAVMSITSEIKDGAGMAMVKVKNFGSVKARRTVYLYTDGRVFGSREIELNPEEEKNSLFSNISIDTEELMASIDEDCLEEDNTRYAVLNREENKKIYLCSDGNVFLESALKILPNIKLYKGEETDGLAGYNLYVFDGKMPKSFPKDGNIMIFNPTEENELIECGEEIQISNMKVTGNIIGNIEFDISKSRKMITPEWGYNIMNSDETSLIIGGEKGKQKIIVFGFDLHNTDLPLKKDFPIMMYDIIKWCIPQNIVDGEIFANEGVNINIAAECEEARVITPNNRMIKLDDGFLTDTKETGIYLVDEKIGGESKISKFAVNSNNSLNSDLRRNNLSEGGVEKLLNEIESNYEIQLYLMIILMIVLFAEWWVYNHDI